MTNLLRRGTTAGKKAVVSERMQMMGAALRADVPWWPLSLLTSKMEMRVELSNSGASIKPVSVKEGESRGTNSLERCRLQAAWCGRAGGGCFEGGSWW